MSEPIRLALVVEGPTDPIIISAAIASLVEGREFIIRVLQPEYSEAFEGIAGSTGMGWSGIYRWCRQTVAEGNGRLRDSVLFNFQDLLIVHLDADVVGKTYASGRLTETVEDLPCEQPCPPASATTDPLRKVLLRWLGESDVPPRVVFCTPSKSMEAWVMAALFPHSRVLAKSGWECHPNPEAQLGQQPKKHRISKRHRDYEAKKAELTRRWPVLREKLAEAGRFSEEFVTAWRELPSVDNAEF